MTANANGARRGCNGGIPLVGIGHGLPRTGPTPSPRPGLGKRELPSTTPLQA